MMTKQISLINKAYDSLYNVNSKYGIFLKELYAISDFMILKGYKIKINSFDKCVFIKIKK